MVQVPATTLASHELCASDRAQLFDRSEDLQCLTRQDSLADWLGGLREWLGVSEIVIAAGAVGALDRAGMVGAGYDTGWMDLYAHERFALVDPIVCGIVRGRRFVNRENAIVGGWATSGHSPNGPTLARFLEAARDYGRLGCGFASGAVINGNLALYSVVTERGQRDERASLALCALRPLLFQALIRVLLPGPVFPSLSPRERAILECLASGFDDPQIADALSISVSTVRFHLGNVFEKLGARNRCHAVAIGFQIGLLRR
ncbi:MAG: helix-turn-helix transcriptional regulator [Rhodanobacteraceae bacterium]